MAIREGTWTIRSESDPRWNKSGRGMVGGLTQPKGCEFAIKFLTAKFGPPPEDLQWSYMKD